VLVSRAVGRLQAQGGLRLEEARTQFDLPLTSQHFDKHYASAYPSAVLSYSVSDTRTVRASYSRRVSRPSPFQLNPIEIRQDNRNVTRGNPTLDAEYIDAVELGFQEARAWGSLQINPFIKHASHGIRELQFVDTSGVSVSSFANLTSGFQLGTDVTVSYRRGPLTSSLGGSVSYNRTDASNLTGTFTATDPSIRTVWWNVRGNGTWKFSTLADAQLFASFRPPRKTESSTTLAQVGLSMGVRYMLWGDHGNVALRVTDPFNMQKYGYRTASGAVVEYAERFYGARAVYVAITRNFGQSLRLRAKSESEESITGPPPPAP
jgi:outer membrane cobalamin receptor